ncbi:hypothetical protein M8J76_004960 [Diaphorina citri]|nr:hypothetical protein M8J76_004960 [Diaphorina citri]
MQKIFVSVLCLVCFVSEITDAVKFRRDLKVFVRYNVKVNMFPPNTIFAYADGFRLNWDIAPKKKTSRGTVSTGHPALREPDVKPSYSEFLRMSLPIFTGTYLGQIRIKQILKHVKITLLPVLFQYFT